jgi:serine/threonine-protein kinase
MTPVERHKRIGELFNAALQMEPADRAAYLDGACAGDESLRRDVESLLAANDQAGSFIEKPVAVFEGFIAKMTKSLEGQRIGGYQLAARIGSGGMGEVYQARDMTLNRQVAIKVLLPAVANDPERLARFRREAQVLASLNHPHIAQIHGFEDADGVRALVMELVEGPTLADRIARRAGSSGSSGLPLDEALAIARQIAEALEAAHERGIIHRDLKPANIKVREDGTVKVLDFGLAKALDTASGAGGDPMDSPTLSAHATEDGIILGTAAYMSPEQARGKAVDTRTDIWAFGCVLYEMLVGRRAFDAEGVSDTLARVIEREPDWSRLPAKLPPALRTYLERCLRKDPRQRVQAIGDIRLALEGAFDTAVPAPAAPVVVSQWRRVVLAGAAAIVASGAIVGSLTWMAMRQPPPRVSRLQVATSGASEVAVGFNDRDLAITPDGSKILYVGPRGTIFVRALDTLAPTAVFTSGSGDPRGLFTSPDGQWIGFVEGSTLKKVAVTGGPAITLATLAGAVSSGAAWAADDTIIFASEVVATGLQRISASGGAVEVLTRPDAAQGEADHLWPEMLPDGRSVLFTITSLKDGLAAAQIAILDLETGKRQVVLRGGSHAHYVPSGHLIYGQSGRLQAVAFDLDRREVRGAPVTVVPDVVISSYGGLDVVAARDGTLAYLSVGSVEGTPRTLVWVDRQGVETPIGAPSRPYFLPALSPDGTRLAVFANDQEGDVWLWDLGRSTFSRLTLVPGRDVLQVWTPDSRRVIFSSERTGGRNLFWQAADGTGAAEQLLESPHTLYPMGVSPDGRQLIFSDETPQTGIDLMTLELDGTRRVTPVLQSRFNERNGTISPNGRWLAYEADDSGRFEIYVRRYPDVNNSLSLVSTNGGTKPIWSQSGQDLFYVAPSGAVMRVGVTQGPTWSATKPSVVVKEGYVTNPVWWGRSYDVSRDGQRFLMIKEGGPDGTVPPTSLVVVQHWFEELKRLVPNTVGQ